MGVQKTLAEQILQSLNLPISVENMQAIHSVYQKAFHESRARANQECEAREKVIEAMEQLQDALDDWNDLLHGCDDDDESDLSSPDVN